MVRFERLELPPRGREIVVEMSATLLAGVREQLEEAVEVREEGLHGQLRVNRRLEVEHGRVRVVADPAENLVPGLCPQVN